MLPEEESFHPTDLFHMKKKQFCIFFVKYMSNIMCLQEGEMSFKSYVLQLFLCFLVFAHFFWS